MGHFDTTSAIEAYVRGLPTASTVVRPSALMEILTLPGMGLDRGAFAFFMRPDQPMQFLAVADVGRGVAAVLADPTRYGGEVLELAGDAVTGDELAAAFTRAAGRPVAYARFPDALLAANAFLGGLARLVDDGRLAGRADLAALRRQFPGLPTLDAWLAGAGGPALRAAMHAVSGELALR